MNAGQLRLGDPSGDYPATKKNTFTPYAVANTVLSRARAATIPRYSSNIRRPNRSNATIAEQSLGTATR
ncbi:hypothetical protein [Rhodococcus sp. ACS1]|uniref:hypothetical protein n=1 Tax=Rhodococcus sp. ACS1 TaxID=2028570 RepID=UPI0015CB362E|nr:hypothetical protein [Rhodococcus sp. ACS1]